MKYVFIVFVKKLVILQSATKMKKVSFFFFCISRLSEVFDPGFPPVSSLYSNRDHVQNNFSDHIEFTNNKMGIPDRVFRYFPNLE